jgi:hypothetical protein
VLLLPKPTCLNDNIATRTDSNLDNPSHPHSLRTNAKMGLPLRTVSPNPGQRRRESSVGNGKTNTTESLPSPPKKPSPSDTDTKAHNISAAATPPNGLHHDDGIRLCMCGGLVGTAPPVRQDGTDRASPWPFAQLVLTDHARMWELCRSMMEELQGPRMRAASNGELDDHDDDDDDDDDDDEDDNDDEGDEDDEDDEDEEDEKDEEQEAQGEEEEKEAQGEEEEKEEEEKEEEEEEEEKEMEEEEALVGFVA